MSYLFGGQNVLMYILASEQCLSEPYWPKSNKIKIVNVLIS